MKIYKFGGASVKNAEGVCNLCRIVGGANDKLVVVVSAMGKTTNALEAVLDSFFNRKPDLEACIEAVVDYHNAIVDELFTPQNRYAVDEQLAQLYGNLRADLALKPSLSYDYEYDRIVSYGELISTTIVAAYLHTQGVRAKFVDIRNYLKTDDNYREGNVDMKLSHRLINDVFNFVNYDLYVTQGFIAGTLTNQTTTLGREGSDYTAALLANLLDAESVTIWKDVPGILNADPRIEPNTVLIPSLRYQDAVELSYSGAQIIHPKTIRPLENKRIPLLVKPFGDPTAEGSRIAEDGVGPINVPVYIWRKNQILITMRAKDFAFALESSLSEIFEIIHHHRLKVSLIQSSAVTISVCVDNTRFVPEAIAELQKHFNVTYNENLSLLTIRGTTPEILEKAKAGKTIMLSQTTRRTARLVVVEQA